jgi:hypothetical protein
MLSNRNTLQQRATNGEGNAVPASKSRRCQAFLLGPGMRTTLTTLVQLQVVGTTGVVGLGKNSRTVTTIMSAKKKKMPTA